MKQKITRITASVITACILLTGCDTYESRSTRLPAEHPDPIASADPSSTENYRPGIPIIPDDANDFSTSSSKFNPNIPDNIQELIESSSTREPVSIPEPDRTALLTDYTQKWAYNHLDLAQKSVYELLYNSVNSGEYGFEFSDRLLKLHIDKNDLEKIYWAFDYDNPQFIELGNGYGYNYTGSSVTSLKSNQLRADENGDGYASLRSEFESAAQNVLNGARQQPEGYEQLLYIHDWIVNNTEYRRNGPAYIYEADGAIVHGIALCEGYSKSFMYLAQSLGYSCVCVCGKANGEDHMWNMVELDGNWYHVDATWDDPVALDGSQTLRHDYFLISDSTIREDHYIETPFTIPKAGHDYRG